ncbi:hypothetical protein D3H35_00600 [Cohnella faecalis]|uniref:Uncharacterized protein n=1 Tax=Cohnella faecalis TaxID=2315694 RepID=A0A398D1P5_9BACL|nr:hypothetical protein D3H35_00600 [Cohnella faecalis]
MTPLSSAIESWMEGALGVRAIMLSMIECRAPEDIRLGTSASSRWSSSWSNGSKSLPFIVRIREIAAVSPSFAKLGKASIGPKIAMRATC